MKFRSILFLAGAMSLLGAGCASSDKPTPPVSTPPAATPPVETQVDTTASSTSSEKPPVMKTYAFPGVLDASELNKKIRIKTTLGDIMIQIDPAAGPKAASNFVYLVQQSFYDGTIFHRVIPGFMIQGGDPTGTGSGGPGYKFADDPVHGKYDKGIVAMANAGPNTNGSQFFIMVDSVGLPPSYSIFGRVISGQDIADKISMVDRSEPGRLDRPITEIKMISVSIE